MLRVSPADREARRRRRMGRRTREEGNERAKDGPGKQCSRETELPVPE